MKKKIFRWAKLAILIYCIIGIAFYYLQDKLLMRPLALDRKASYGFSQPYTEVNLNYNKETNLNIIRFLPAGAVQAGVGGSLNPAGADSLRPAGAGDSARGVVLYFHGNRRNTGWYASHAPDFTKQGYEVWMMDYPGFGKSTGPHGEKNLYDYALVEYKLARSRFKPSQIIIYGKSLGTGIAAQLAAVRDCRRLILECPYYSMTSLVRHYLPVYPVGTMLHYRFPTYEYLPAVTAPVTLIHGTGDWQVPYSNAERLKALLKPGDELITIEGGSHNDLANFPLFHQKLDSLLKL